MASLDDPSDSHDIFDSEDSADENNTSSIRSKKRPNRDFERVNLADLVVEGESLSVEEKENIQTVRLSKKISEGREKQTEFEYRDVDMMRSGEGEVVIRGRGERIEGEGGTPAQGGVSSPQGVESFSHDGVSRSQDGVSQDKMLENGFMYDKFTQKNLKKTERDVYFFFFK